MPPKEKSDDGVSNDSLDKFEAFNFLPIVRELLKRIASADTHEKDIEAIATKFSNKMKEAHDYLRSTSGLDLTEEQQNQRINELQSLIQQKRNLIKECSELYYQLLESDQGNS